MSCAAVRDQRDRARDDAAVRRACCNSSAVLNEVHYVGTRLCGNYRSQQQAARFWQRMRGRISLFVDMSARENSSAFEHFFKCQSAENFFVSAASSLNPRAPLPLPNTQSLCTRWRLITCIKRRYSGAIPREKERPRRRSIFLCVCLLAHSPPSQKNLQLAQ